MASRVALRIVRRRSDPILLRRSCWSQHHAFLRSRFSRRPTPRRRSRLGALRAALSLYFVPERRTPGREDVQIGEPLRLPRRPVPLPTGPIPLRQIVDRAANRLVKPHHGLLDLALGRPLSTGRLAPCSTIQVKHLHAIPRHHGNVIAINPAPVSLHTTSTMADQVGRGFPNSRRAQCPTPLELWPRWPPAPGRGYAPQPLETTTLAP